MSPTIPNELLEVLSLLQALPDEKVEEPTFEAPSSSEVVILAARIFGDRSKCKSKNPIKAQYLEAIKFASQLPKNKRLETFNRFHQKCASYLINAFYRIPLDKLKQAIQYAQKKVNASLLKYALSVALLHRDDAIKAHLQIPSHLDTEPGMYFDIVKITHDMHNPDYTDVQKDDGLEKVYVNVEYNFTATNLDPEHKVAYFREDIGLNLHHRHWHEVYPFMGPEEIVKKDRRGELFFYMHEQFVARFNFERFSNGLPKVVAYSDIREPVEEAYFPKLHKFAQASQFCSRPVNSALKDLRRPEMNEFTKLSTMERWIDRIFEAIDLGYAHTIDPDTKQEVLKKIDEETGIDELGNTIEAVEALSWNFQYYGDMHNKGHLFFSYVHDPDHRFREDSGVMSHTETTLRDPIFYRWHAFIDEIFQHYKRTLPPYTKEQKQFEGINVEGVKILPQEHHQHSPCETNVLTTYWEKDAVDITQGILSQNPNEIGKRVYAVFTHLQHNEFEYEITVKNTLCKDVTGTVRIFLAPHKDESGTKMAFNDQRTMFVEMDKFTVQLKKQECTVIRRKSTESAVTIPFEKSFMTLSDAKKLATDEKLNEELNKAANGYCGCGWPHHLLVGKGTTGKGLLCDLFVMLTNYEEDKVEESPLEQKCCDKSSLSYCGVRNNKYPDKKPMGFPFDRDINDANAFIEDFMADEQVDDDDDEEKNAQGECNNEPPKPSRLSNIMVVSVLVRHEDGPPKCGKSLRNAGYNDGNCKKFFNTAA